MLIYDIICPLYTMIVHGAFITGLTTMLKMVFLLHLQRYQNSLGILLQYFKWRKIKKTDIGKYYEAQRWNYNQDFEENATTSTSVSVWSLKTSLLLPAEILSKITLINETIIQPLYLSVKKHKNKISLALFNHTLDNMGEGH